MASIHVRETTGKWQVAFRWQGKPYSRCTGTTLKKDANLVKRRVEDTIWRIQNAGLALPDDADVAEFIFSGGAVTEPTKAAPAPPVTLGCLIDTYKASIVPGKRQANTLSTEKIHQSHLLELLGKDTPIRSLTLPKIQFAYVNVRSSKSVQPYTITKELKCLRQMWNWAVRFGHVASGPSWSFKDLDFPIGRPTLTFNTFEAIKRRVDRGGLKPAEAKLLWQGLYLTGGEITELLDYASTAASDSAFLYPMIACAALTGMRRSEILRSEVEDWDFAHGTVLVHEMKRIKGQASTRAVELHVRLAEIMKGYIAPIKGRYVFKDVTIDQAQWQLRRTLSGHEKFRHIRGWHVLRHSFISALALAGVSLPVIQAIVGHMSPEMTEHYTHIGPKQTNRAIDRLLP